MYVTTVFQKIPNAFTIVAFFLFEFIAFIITIHFVDFKNFSPFLFFSQCFNKIQITIFFVIFF